MMGWAKHVWGQREHGESPPPRAGGTWRPRSTRGLAMPFPPFSCSLRSCSCHLGEGHLTCRNFSGQGPRFEAPVQRRKWQTVIALPQGGLVLGGVDPWGPQADTHLPGSEVMTISTSTWSWVAFHCIPRFDCWFWFGRHLLADWMMRGAGPGQRLEFPGWPGGCWDSARATGFLRCSREFF